MSSINRREFVRWGSLAALAAVTRDGVGAMSKVALPEVDLAFLPSNISLKRRKDWTKQVPKPWILKPSEEFDRITVHHTAAVSKGDTDRAVIAEIESVCLEHIARGYGDIGYHFVVDVRGVVWEGRSLAYQGAHVSKQNEGNIGIVLLGNFETQTLNEKQIKALELLAGALRDEYQIKRHRIYGHRDLGKSSCPGKNLYQHVEKMKKPEEPSPSKSE